MITNGAAEQHDGTTAGQNRPLVGDADRQVRVGETKPVITVTGLFHSRIVAIARRRWTVRGQPCATEMYDLVFVEQGPLPPHERSWRHPSELGPTRHDVVDVTGRRSHLVALAGGTLSALAVAVAVVAVTPRPMPGPVALSATTTPMPVQVSAPLAKVAGLDQPTAAAPARALAPAVGFFTSFTAFPHAVTSSPQLDLDGTGIASQAPRSADMVFVRTEAVTYRLRWDEATMLTLSDGSVIFDANGDLVAYVTKGELQRLVDD